MLDASERLARECFANHHRLGDVEEPRIVDGRVVLPGATADAIAAYRDAGFCALGADADAGGPGLPYSAVLLSDAHFLAANVSTAGYLLLARGERGLGVFDPHAERERSEVGNVGRVGGKCVRREIHHANLRLLPASLRVRENHHHGFDHVADLAADFLLSSASGGAIF